MNTDIDSIRHGYTGNLEKKDTNTAGTGEKYIHKITTPSLVLHYIDMYIVSSQNSKKNPFTLFLGTMKDEVKQN